MNTVAVIASLIVATVARARQRGHTWKQIFAWPSRWFNWTFAGREFEETFSAYVGYQVREKAPPITLWRALCFMIDVMSIPWEWHHCAESLYRLEKANRSR